MPGAIAIGAEAAERSGSKFVMEPIGPQVLKTLEAVAVYRLIGEKVG
ncbi:MAG: hypothetical protein HYZ81_19295 [Nitrospinae bacterium]|nr:hypothetical protein [Nitrospinota bacterium]